MTWCSMLRRHETLPTLGAFDPVKVDAAYTKRKEMVVDAVLCVG